MKSILTAIRSASFSGGFVIGSLVYLVACTTDPTTGKQTIDQTQVNSIAALAIDLAAAHYGVSPDSVTAIKAGAAQIAGIAMQAQANLGKTPASANVAQGAAIPSVGTAVQSQLPNVPINQATVNALFDAAKATKTVSAP